MSALYTALYASKERLTLAQLLRGWARELGVDETDLAEQLLPDIGNRRRQREGLPLLPPSDGLPLAWLARLTRPHFEAKVTISREEVLAFAAHARLQPPSWWAQPAAAEPAADGQEGAPIYRTGAPGRPTSMELIITEMERRSAEGEMITTELASEARALAAWLKAKHPAAPQLVAKTLQNTLRQKWRSLGGGKVPK